jgi:hypothetical protein
MSMAAPSCPGTPGETRRTTRRVVGEEGTRLGGYPGPGLRDREIVSVPAAGGSVLVIDRDAITHLDERLLAHLASDEPAVNRRLICAMYLADEEGRYCGRVTAQDRKTTPPAVHASSVAHADVTVPDLEGIL